MSDGGDNDEKEDNTRTQEIYANLFGESDSAGGSSSRQLGGSTGRFGGDPSTADKKEQVSQKIDIADIPIPLWTDSMEISEERWQTKIEFDDIPDWSPDFVSRISKERVEIFKGGIPTLSELAQLPLPPPPFPHPGHGQSKEYANLRRQAIYEKIRKEVVKAAEPKLPGILTLPTWQEKQDAVDALFESVEHQLRVKESILSGHPQFGRWVERALESYLKTFKKETPTELASSDGAESADEKDEASDEKAVPVFMDCYSAKDPEDQMVPSILMPLKPHPHDGPGRMVEEWELSAHSKSKRIMLRQSTRDIARALQESESARVLVTGRRGVGKTAAIASVVAAARKSGYIVLYMPDGNRLHKLGYYIEPNPKNKELYDLPVLSQEVCDELMTRHESDLEGMEADEATMQQFFTERQLEDLSGYSGSGSMLLVDLLKAAKANVAHAAMCFTVTVDVLTKQTDKPFLMALDEFNCYFEPGHYFHMDYDDSVETAIPYDQINLFKPALDAMALSLEEDEEIPLKTPIAPKRGGVIVGISESCAIARKCTDALTAYASRSVAAGHAGAALHILEVPRFSELEVDHILANYESIGIGHLRNDRGETVMNKEGIAYLRMISSDVGQNLLDVCCY
ncbi:Mitochondrial ribosomal death-associated protein 3 [Seminavis robusta]|uniref:Small ribosomal subunit protein mS29 n=1 Tax=Seminavis robusta TaxID=568900 RepID=A0A9N8DLT8_9STRA|nr:Mitochondrial ribosomal death-associated protein 3 [Seminavis robusta]|eukprot:Sro196_g083600.1 Mitochondrial ribosomal death-associated protein 3 (627) ;mRNA; r:68714-70829